MTPLPTELPQTLLIVLGVIAPVIFQVVTRLVKNELARFAIVVLLSAVTGLAAVVLGKFPITMSVEFISILFTLATIAYKVVWKPLFNTTGLLKAKPTTY